MDLVKELKDMTFLDWTEQKLSPGTPGCFLKAYEETEHGRVYYKLLNYDSYRGVFGHECINELVVSRVMDLLKIPHLQYRLIHAEICIRNKRIETWICASDNFRRPDEQKVGFDLKIADLLERDKEYILNGLNEILTQNHLTKIWEMIWKRWCRYEEICSEGSALWK